MRDKDMLADLLLEMSEQPNGRIALLLPNEDRQSPEEFKEAQVRNHHLRLLHDAGFAVLDRFDARITYQGYDYLEQKA